MKRKYEKIRDIFKEHYIDILSELDNITESDEVEITLKIRGEKFVIELGESRETR